MSVVIKTRESITKLHAKDETALHAKNDTWLHRVGVTHITIRFSVEQMLFSYPHFVSPGGEYPDFVLQQKGLKTTATPTTDGELDLCSENDYYNWDIRGLVDKDHIRATTRWMLYAKIDIDGREWLFPFPLPGYFRARDVVPGIEGWRPNHLELPGFVYTNGAPVTGPLNPVDGLGMEYTFSPENAYAELKLRVYQYESITLTSHQVFAAGRENPLIPYEVEFDAEDHDPITPTDQWLDGKTWTLRGMPVPGETPLSYQTLDYINVQQNAVAGRSILQGWGGLKLYDPPPGPQVITQGWDCIDGTLELCPKSLAYSSSRPWVGFIPHTFSPPGGTHLPEGEIYTEFDDAYRQVEELMLANLTVINPQRLRATITYDYEETSGEYHESWTRQWDYAIPYDLSHKRIEAHSHSEIITGPSPAMFQTRQWNKAYSTELLITWQQAQMEFNAIFAPLNISIETNAEEA